MEPEVLAGPVAEGVRTTAAEDKTESRKTSPAADGLQHLPTNDDFDSNSDHSQRTTPGFSTACVVEFSGTTLPPSGQPKPAAHNLRLPISEPRRSRHQSPDALVPPITD